MFIMQSFCLSTASSASVLVQPPPHGDLKLHQFLSLFLLLQEHSERLINVSVVNRVLCNMIQWDLFSFVYEFTGENEFTSNHVAEPM